MATVDIPLQPTIAPQPLTSQQQGRTPTTEPQATGDRTKSYVRIKVGQLEFNSLNGDILGNPYIRLSTYQHSSARVILNDPDDVLRPDLEKNPDIEIEIGFVGAEKQVVLIGKLYSVGRIPPDGTEIEAIDPSVQLQGTGSSVQVASEKPAPVAVTSTQAIGAAIATALNAQLAAPPATVETNAAIETTSNSTLQPIDILKAIKTIVQPEDVVTPAEQAVANLPGMQFENQTATATNQTGSVRINQGALRAAQTIATAIGDVVVSDGNTIRQVSPGQAESSGVILDYDVNPSAFIGRPRITKKTGMQLQSGYGALTVQGWSPNDKNTVGVTVVTPGVAPAFDPNAAVNVPEWGEIKLGDPITPNNLYTWADATYNGERIPESQSVMEGIVKIAQFLDQLSRQYNDGKRFQINSWYRTPAINAQVGGSSSSRHMSGDAVDFYFDDMDSLYATLDSTHEGGVAIAPGSFIHVDALTDPPRRRWTY